MSALVAFVVGAVVSALLWRAMAPQFVTSEVLRRENYRGHGLPVAAGVIVVLAVVAVAAVSSLVVTVRGDASADLARHGRLIGFVAGAIGFGLLGLLDDLVGGASTKGFKGHLGALARGEVTTGAVKLVWGVLLGVLVAPEIGWAGVRGGVLIAACANLANLFDRAPGRTVKASLVGGAVVVVIAAVADGAVNDVSGMTLVLGAGLGMLVADLRERCMLGDTGANVLGAAVGYGLTVALAGVGEWVALAVVVALNVASEFVSFTRVIDATPPLRFLDRLGAIPERGR